MPAAGIVREDQLCGDPDRRAGHNQRCAIKLPAARTLLRLEIRAWDRRLRLVRRLGARRKRSRYTQS